MSSVIYLAGPLFNLAEREFNESLCHSLVALGYVVYLPQSYEPPPSAEDRADDIRKKNMDEIRRCNWMVAICDGMDIDSGTAWELGYASAHCRRMLIRTDFRGAGDDGQGFGNLMITRNVDAAISFDSRQLSIGIIADTIHDTIVQHG